MKKINIKINNASLIILFLGLVSTVAGSLWLLMVRYTVSTKGLIGFASYYSRGVEEIVFCALLHIIIAAAVYSDERKRENSR